MIKGANEMSIEEAQKRIANSPLKLLQDAIGEVRSNMNKENINWLENEALVERLAAAAHIFWVDKKVQNDKDYAPIIDVSKSYNELNLQSQEFYKLMIKKIPELLYLAGFTIVPLIESSKCAAAGGD